MSRKPLQRPLPLDPAGFEQATKLLTGREVGCLVLLALAWWPTGEMPTRPCDLGRVLGIEPDAAVEITRRLRPQFEGGSYFATLRAAHVSKAERRARAGRIGMAKRWHGSAVA